MSIPPRGTWCGRRTSLASASAAGICGGSPGRRVHASIYARIRTHTHTLTLLSFSLTTLPPSLCVQSSLPFRPCQCTQNKEVNGSLWTARRTNTYELAAVWALVGCVFAGKARFTACVLLRSWPMGVDERTQHQLCPAWSHGVLPAQSLQMCMETRTLPRQ